MTSKEVSWRCPQCGRVTSMKQDDCFECGYKRFHSYSNWKCLVCNHSQAGPNAWCAKCGTPKPLEGESEIDRAKRLHTEFLRVGWALYHVWTPAVEEAINHDVYASVFTESLDECLSRFECLFPEEPVIPAMNAEEI